MTKRLLISLLALIPCFCLAQIRLSGFVYDELSQPMPFANVKLINRADSTFVLGTLTKEDGGFCIETSRTDVLLKVSMVGYVVKYVDIHEGIMAPVVMTPDNKLKTMMNDLSLEEMQIVNGGHTGNCATCPSCKTKLPGTRPYGTGMNGIGAAIQTYAVAAWCWVASKFE